MKIKKSLLGAVYVILGSVAQSGNLVQSLDPNEVTLPVS